MPCSFGPLVDTKSACEILLRAKQDQLSLVLRVALFVSVFTLGLAGAARASSITTFEFKGLLTSGPNSTNSLYPVAPTNGLAIGDPFTIFLNFVTNPLNPFEPHEVSFSMGQPGRTLAGTTMCLVGGCPFATAFTRPGVTFYPQNGWNVTSPNGPLLQTLFTISLNPGWQSGQMSIWLENAFIGIPVSGSITSMQRVPEPSTLWLLAFGIVAVAVRNRFRFQKPRCC